MALANRIKAIVDKIRDKEIRYYFNTKMARIFISSPSEIDKY